MTNSSRRPLTVTARITVEIEDASEWSNLLQRSLVEAFKGAISASRPAPSHSPASPAPQPQTPKSSPMPVQPTPKQAVPDEHLLLDTKQVAELLGISERTLWAWSRSGIAPRPIKIGRMVRFSADEIREWVANGCPRERQREHPRKGR